MRKRLHWLIPTIIAPEETFTPEILENLSDEIEQYFRYNRSFRNIYSVCLSTVNLLPLFTKGRTLRLLKLEARQNFLNKLHQSRNGLFRGLATITGLPIKMIYYNQESEQIRLGFNPRALKDEANARPVSRSKSQAS